MSKIAKAEKKESPQHRKAQTKLWSFKTMLDAALSAHGKWSVEEVIQEWWTVAFGVRSLPEKGVRLDRIALAISYQLLYAGYAQHDIPMGEKFLQNHSAAVNLRPQDMTEQSRVIDECMEFSQMGQVELHFTKESGEMAAKKKAPPKKKAGGKDATPNLAAERKNYCARLIVEQKHTDEEILGKVNEKFPKMKVEFASSRISMLRGELNAGERKGFEKPKKPYERIVVEDGKRIPASQSTKPEPRKQKEKKRPTPPKKSAPKKKAPKKKKK